MRIALVADEDPGWGGIGTYTGVLGKALKDLGHDVHLVLRGWEEDGPEELDGLTAHRLTVPDPSWRRGTVACVSRLHVARESIIFSARVARLLATIEPDVAEAPDFHAAGLLAVLRGRLPCRFPPVVARLHAPSFVTARLAAEGRDLDLRAGELAEAASVRWARAISSPSHALAEIVEARWRLRPGRVRIVPNPIDDELFAPLAEDRATAGSILVVGRVERAKGQDVLLEALPAIRGAVPEAHVRLIGADGGAVERLLGRARELGLSQAIDFEGAVPRAELPHAYCSASVCVVPSRFEAFSYTCLEAMACGRAVIAARVGGLPEVVRDGVDGLLVPTEDPAALAGAVRRLLLDPAERRRLGEAARARVLAAFAAPTVGARMAELYAEVAR
ncbi:MAG TPA: glycosyltransferase family 4 protein [Solirubrobacteraceae bacterium]|jgi:glycosyltransferase involved in cell wall biosynthesis|nr:glycosyltransferase family 4 protein [Solirubrobacteraceae bacterium]